MAALSTSEERIQAVLGNMSLYIFKFSSVADGDTFAIPEPAVIAEYWYQSHHSDVVTQSVNVSSGTATFQVGATAPGTLFVLGATR